MKFFFFSNSANEVEVGFFPQIKHEPLSYTDVTTPKGRIKNFDYLFESSESVIHGFEFYKKAKPTDFVSAVNFHRERVLVSSMLFSFLNTHTELLSKKAALMHNGKCLDYYLIKFNTNADDLLDIPNCKFYFIKEGKIIQRMQFLSLEEMITFRTEVFREIYRTKISQSLVFYETHFKDEAKNHDVLLFSSLAKAQKVKGLLMSERLKVAIEKEGFTGIHFEQYDPYDFDFGGIVIEDYPLVTL